MWGHTSGCSRDERSERNWSSGVASAIRLLMGVIVASQGASTGGLCVGNWLGSVRSDDADIEVYEPFTRDTAVDGAEAVSRVASRAREAIVDVPSVLRVFGKVVAEAD